MVASPSRFRLMVFAPTRRAASETFIRANLDGLPFRTEAYFGDERPVDQPLRWLYGHGIVLSKLFTRLRLLRLAGLPAALVAHQLIRRTRPQVVLAEFGFEAVRVMEACRWSGVPLVVHFRGSDASARSRIGRLEGRYRRLFSIASAVIVKSEVMAERLTTLGVARERLLISPSGANAALFHGSHPGTAPPRLLAVGRFVPKKGPLHTLRAFHRCWMTAAGGEQPILQMVGDGPLLRQAQQYVADCGLDQAVQFLGVRAPQEVADLMRGARAFVQHSLVANDGDSEGSPVAVMEAQLSGLPVIATRHGGIPEVVMDGETGLLVDEGDDEAMALAMQRLLDDPLLSQRLGEAGHQRVLSCFTVQHHLQDVSELLRRVGSAAEPLS